MGLLAGIGTGLVLASGTLLGLYAFEHALHGVNGFLAWLGLFTTGFGLMLALAPWLFAEPKERSAAPTQQQYAAPTPPPAVVVTRYATGTVMGRLREPLEIATEPRSSRWLAWQRGAESLLAWYTIRRTLTAEALVDQEHAFSSRPDWVTFTDEWQRVDLAVKVNGRATQLAAPLQVIRARIASGQIEWTDAHDPPAIAAPPRPAVGMVIEAQKA